MKSQRHLGTAVEFSDILGMASDPSENLRKTLDTSDNLLSP